MLAGLDGCGKGLQVFRALPGLRLNWSRWCGGTPYLWQWGAGLLLRPSKGHCRPGPCEAVAFCPAYWRTMVSGDLKSPLKQLVDSDKSLCLSWHL